jgi:membrane protein
MATAEADLRENVAPDDIPAPGWKAIVRRTVKEFSNDNLTDWAAALTYYAVLALFPALIVLVALLGIFGQYPQTTNDLIDILKTAGADPKTLNSLKATINGVVKNKGGAGALLGVGLAAALWSASGYIGAFMRASNAIYETPEGRPVWKLRPLQVLVTLVMTLLFALVLVAIVVSGPLAEAIGNKIGLGHTAVTVWGIAKWPVLAFVVSLMLATLYYAAPNAKLPKFQWISPGAIVALVVWVIASVAFFFYARNFGSYNKTYGTLGGMITLLVWMWLTNVAILFGQELNAEIERGRELAAGKPAIDDIQLPLRDEPKKDPEEQAAQISRDAVAAQEKTDGNGGGAHDEAVAQLDQSSSGPAGARPIDRPS